MKIKHIVLIALTAFSLGVNADLKRAIAFDQAGEYEKSAKELYKISQLATRGHPRACLLYTSPSPRDVEESRMPSSA